MKDEVDVEVCFAYLLKETEKALLVEIHGIGDEWIPKAAISSSSEIDEHSDIPGMLWVKRWFAKKKGWVNE